MRRLIAAALAALVLSGCASMDGGGSRPYSSGYSSGRSQAALGSFKRSNPCPSTGRSSGACPGYQVDHIRPLAAGGADHKSNMQWLSTSAHKAKTRAERKSCAYGCGRRKK